MKISEILTGAADLITPRKAWTRKVLARKNRWSWEKVYPTDPKAKCWCALGALIKAAEGDDSITDAVDFVNRLIAPTTLGQFNDHRPHMEVVGMLRAAAASAFIREQLP